MLFTSPTRSSSQAGFTLIEMLIVAPLIILILGTFIGVMISMVGDVLSTRDRNSAAYNIQGALSQIEQDVKLSSAFLNTSGPLPSPQGPNGTAGAFTANSLNDASLNVELILREPATNVNPVNAHQLIYDTLSPNACATTQTASNTKFNIEVIYFVQNSSLWRRTIVPPYSVTSSSSSSSPTNICNPPWQQNSCPAGSAMTGSAAGGCQVPDTLVLANVQDSAQYYGFDIEYYPAPSSSASPPYTSVLDPTSAHSVGIVLYTRQITAGRTETFRGDAFASLGNPNV